jgi:hypothetical protein
VFLSALSTGTYVWYTVATCGWITQHASLPCGGYMMLTTSSLWLCRNVTVQEATLQRSTPSRTALTTWAVVNACTDLYLTTTFVSYAYKVHRTALSSTLRRQSSRLSWIAMASCAPPTLAVMAVAVLYLALPQTSWFVIALGATDNLALISVLFTLNARPDRDQPNISYNASGFSEMGCTHGGPRKRDAALIYDR